MARRDETIGSLSDLMDSTGEIPLYEEVPKTAQEIAQDRAFVLQYEQRRLHQQRIRKKKAIQEAIRKSCVDLDERGESGAFLVWKRSDELAEEEEEDEEEVKLNESPSPVPLKASPSPSSASIIRSISPEEEKEEDKVWPVYCGWVIKQGGGTSTFSRKNWKRRWFELKDGIMTYHKKIGSPKLGEIKVVDMLRISSDLERREYKGFSVETVDRTYHLLCPNGNDIEEWLKSLDKARSIYARKSFSKANSALGLIF